MSTTPRRGPEGAAADPAPGAASRGTPAVRDAALADTDAIRTLLAAASLPVADLDDGTPRRFWVATDAGRTVGAIALEVHGRHGLLRSLVVAPEYRGRGLGAALVARLERTARDESLESIWLLTQTAAPLFRRLGYADVERRAAPPELQRTPEFRSLCPASAATLRRIPS